MNLESRINNFSRNLIFNQLTTPQNSNLPHLLLPLRLSAFA
jgi:hypothetical protein